MNSEVWSRAGGQSLVAPSILKDQIISVESDFLEDTRCCRTEYRSPCTGWRPVRGPSQWEIFVHLFPVTQAGRNLSPRRKLAIVLHETSGITHIVVLLPSGGGHEPRRWDPGALSKPLRSASSTLLKSFGITLTNFELLSAHESSIDSARNRPVSVRCFSIRSRSHSSLQRQVDRDQSFQD